MRSAIAIAVLLALTSSVSANQASPTANRHAVLSDGTPIPLIGNAEQVTITTHKFNDKQKIVQRNEGRQRYIVELNDAPVASHIAALKRQSSTGLSSSTANNRQQQFFVNESVQYAAQLKAQQQRVWSALSNVDRQATLQKSHYKLLNAIVIDTDPLYIQLIEKMPGVKRVSPQKRVYASLTESVPLVKAPKVWSLRDTNQLTLTGHGVDVAVLDTGIDYTHPALGGCIGSQCKVVAGYDFHNQDTDPMDGNGHGTHVAGIIAAQTDDYSGVAPDVKLHAYKVLADEGWGNDTTIIEALEYAADPDGNPATDDAVDVINMSLGGPGDANDPLSLAANAAVEAGIIVVVAAGNDGGFGNIAQSSPAAAAKAITVASTTKNDELSYFSSKGESIAGAPLKPEIAAPGSDIVAPYLNHDTTSLSGTSMASPHVAGAAALLRQLYPDDSVEKIRGRLMAGSVDLGLLPYEQGSGRLDIEQAVNISFYANDGVVSFGQPEVTQGTWQKTLPLTLTNLSGAEQPISLALGDATLSTMPSDVTLSWPQQELVLPPHGQLTVDLTLTVNDVASLSYPENGAFVFTERVEVNSDNHTLTIPVTLENAVSITLQTNEVAGVSLLLHSENNSYNQFFDLAKNSSRTIKVPATQLTAAVTFHGVAGDKFSEYALPENSTVYVLDVLDIQPKPNLIIPLSINVADTLIGVDNLLDENGLPDNINDINWSITDAYFNYGFGSIGVIAFGFERVYLALNSQSKISNAYYGIFGYFPERLSVPNQLRILSIQHPINTLSPGVISLQPQLNNLRDIVLKLPNYDIRQQQAVIFKNINTDAGYVGEFIPMQFDEIVVSVMPELAEHNHFSVGTSELTDDWYETLMSSPAFKPLAVQGVKAGNLNGIWQFNYATDIIDLTGGSSFYSAQTELSGGLLTVREFSNMPEWSVIHDLNANSYSSKMSDMHISWLCDQELITESEFTPTSYEPMLVPELPCALPTFIISFDSWLKDQPYRSHFSSIGIDTESAYIDAINQIKLTEADDFVNDYIVNRLESRLIINAPNYIYNLRAELKLDDGNYIELVKVIDDDLQGVSFDLPMTDGSHVASIKLSYGWNEEFIQELNGVFIFGADAGDADVDGDGVGNNADPDDDNDGYPDTEDAFPLDASEWLDTDADGVGNNADQDDDNDGYADAEDAFPLDNTEWLDTDADGIGNNADPDDDNDGYADSAEAFPLDKTEWLDTDGDGFGNNTDPDDDNDGYADSADAFPLDHTEWLDTDGDGIGNNADNDDDNDGVSDANDAYPLDASRSANPVVTTPAEKSSGGSNSLPWLTLLAFVLLRRVLQQAKRSK